ncbi:geobacillin-26 family protein [Brevibacillus laterosporus]|uniref:geobacillin-26 family protein n=1 Tax=Brevibacillus laterosporus TaxID=1465 RepID=UPI0014441BE7|nr:geobacillin-26 family protein [Brevibacillus laterosporus]NKQ20715.1 geobacillin-26 family protein [Brevibacillus laterosporus]WNX29676.1 geobacillin-26 family protein [Brevibacillus laterosporus]
MKKVILSSALVLSVMASSSIPVFAMDESNQIVEAETLEDSQGNKYKIEILEDNDSERVVRVESKNGITEATYDKMNHTIEFDEDGTLTEVSIADPEEQIKKEKDRQKRSAKDIVRSAHEKYYGYYYVIDKSRGKKYWDVGNGKEGTYVKQTSSNKADLFDYEDKVLDLIKAEATFVATSTVSLSALMASVKGIKSGWGADRMIAFFAGAGFGMTVAVNAADMVIIERKVARAFDIIMEK